MYGVCHCRAVQRIRISRHMSLSPCLFVVQFQLTCSRLSHAFLRVAEAGGGNTGELPDRYALSLGLPLTEFQSGWRNAQDTGQIPVGFLHYSTEQAVLAIFS
ncbi:predicted protein [Histoplasma capsulatum G186AR]|uniref:Uncharacterized protein n=1 Tax=Ajellomyces capsulatus (strain G186AR / H82 / ATCC MYA-2454 / RMSCC 2432) TaxID=447093 RepID=C0NP42_AJECG|nr:uncharacterized protein HCBG_04922 [Histoplasma capsulatum G186AR]EEH06702.1 predicted protein [Histoplasma capsulatum G186AR]